MGTPIDPNRVHVAHSAVASKPVAMCCMAWRTVRGGLPGSQEAISAVLQRRSRLALAASPSPRQVMHISGLLLFLLTERGVCCSKHSVSDELAR